jgi:uncharacterized protein (UPF0262 family)
LIEENSFAPVGDGGPYALHLRMADNLVFDIRLADDTPVVISHSVAQRSSAW